MVDFRVVDVSFEPLQWSYGFAPLQSYLAWNAMPGLALVWCHPSEETPYGIAAGALFDSAFKGVSVTCLFVTKPTFQHMPVATGSLRERISSWHVVITQ
jgi:hypothetical protein